VCVCVCVCVFVCVCVRVCACVQVWLVMNGVDGIGLEDSKVALFESLGGERGLLAAEV